MSTQPRPFYGNNIQEIKDSQITTVSELASQIDTELHYLIFKCLQRNPEERFQNFFEIIDYIDKHFKFAQHIKLSSYLIEQEKYSNFGIEAFSMLQLGRIQEGWDLYIKLFNVAEIETEKIGIMYWEDKDNQWNLIFHSNVINELLRLIQESKSIELFLVLGFIYFELDRLIDSLQCFEKVLNMDKLNSSALVGKARCLDFLNKSQEAAIAYEQALKTDLTDNIFTSRITALNLINELTGYGYTVFTFMSKELMEASIQQPLTNSSFTSVLKAVRILNIFNIKGNSAEKTVELLGILTERNDKELLLELGSIGGIHYLLDRWYGRDSGNQLNFHDAMWIADAIFQAGAYEQALESFQYAAEIEPGDSLVWYNIGTCELALNNIESAIKSLLKSIEINKKNFNAWNTLGHIYKVINDRPAAWQAFQYASQEKTYAKPWFNMAGMKVEEQDYAEAELLLQKSLEIDPQYQNALQLFEEIQELNHSE